MDKDLKKQGKFQDLVKIFEIPDFISGLFLFRTMSNEKWAMDNGWTWKKLLTRGCFCIYPCFTFLLMYGTIQSKLYSNILSWIFVTSRLAIDITVWIISFSIVTNKTSVKFIFDWCEKMYHIQKMFHPKIQELAEDKIMSMHHRAIKIFRLYLWSYGMNIFIMTVGITMIGLVLPERIYPKYTLPLPYFLPFKEQNNLVAFLVTFFVQVYYVFSSSFQTTGMVIIFFAALYIVIYLEIIYIAIELMKKELNQLIIVNSAESKQKIESETKIWVPMLVNMICDVKEVFDKLNDIFSFFFLSMEFCCYGGVFQFGLLVIVVKRQIMYGMSVSLIIVTCFLIFNLLSVVIMDRFAKITEGLYDMPWYDLAPANRKLIHHMMLCGNIKVGLRAAQFHRFDLETFAKVMKAAYVNCLVLKRLVTG